MAETSEHGGAAITQSEVVGWIATEQGAHSFPSATGLGPAVPAEKRRYTLRVRCVVFLCVVDGSQQVRQSNAQPSTRPEA